jgi:Domain of unknown function (DUF4307)
VSDAKARAAGASERAAARADSAGASTGAVTEGFTDTLAERYGRTPRLTKQRRWFAITVGGVFVVAIVAWVIWAGLLGDSAQLSASDTGHVIASERLVTVRFDLAVDAGRRVGCAAEALDESFTVVGWKIIHIQPSTDRIRSFSVDVRTSQQAVTGLIYRCWLE